MRTDSVMNVNSRHHVMAVTGRELCRRRAHPP